MVQWLGPDQQHNYMHNKNLAQCRSTTHHNIDSDPPQYLCDTAIYSVTSEIYLVTSKILQLTGTTAQLGLTTDLHVLRTYISFIIFLINSQLI
jgi:hypothetical protein